MTQRKLCLFDFDGTLTRGDTFLPFARMAVGGRRLALTLLRMLPSIVLMKLHLRDNGKTKERMWHSLFAGMTDSNLRAVAERFADNYTHLWRQDALTLLAGLRREHAEVAVVTASLGCWVRPFMQRVCPDAVVIGTEHEVDGSGICTGRFATPNCYGAEKVHRIMKIYPQRDIYYITAYGDSRGDKPMLEYADQSYYRTLQ